MNTEYQRARAITVNRTLDGQPQPGYPKRYAFGLADPELLAMPLKDYNQLAAGLAEHVRDVENIAIDTSGARLHAPASCPLPEPRTEITVSLRIRRDADGKIESVTSEPSEPPTTDLDLAVVISGTEAFIVEGIGREHDYTLCKQIQHEAGYVEEQLVCTSSAQNRVRSIGDCLLAPASDAWHTYRLTIDE